MPKLSCGCERGISLCPEMRALWEKESSVFMVEDYSAKAKRAYERWVSAIENHLFRMRELNTMCALAKQRNIATSGGTFIVVKDSATNLFRLRTLAALEFGDFPIFVTGIGLLDNVSRETFVCKYSL